MPAGSLCHVIVVVKDVWKQKYPPLNSKPMMDSNSQFKLKQLYSFLI